MVDREKIIRYFGSSGDDEIVAKFLDLMDATNKSCKYRITDFLDPHAYSIAEIVAVNYENIRVEHFGGFQYSERVKVAFVSTLFTGTVDYGILGLLAQWDKRYYDISHRDVLGAYISIGCKRSTIGDIVFVEDGAQFVVEKSLVNFIFDNFTKIGSAPIKLLEIPLTDLFKREEKVKQIIATVADLRLDAVAAAGYGISRSRMVEEIKGQNVKINWQVAKKASQSVSEGDIISFRGRGRVEIIEIRGLTKKGRIGVILKRFV